MNGNAANGGLVLKSGGRLYVTDSTGSGGTRVSDRDGVFQAGGLFWFMNGDGRFMYYSDRRRKGALYRFDAETREPELLLDAPGMNLTLNGEWLYYIDGNDGRLYRCGKDGRGSERLMEERVTGYAVGSGGTLYAATPQGIRVWDAGIRRAERVTNSAAACLIFAGDRLVFADREKRYALTVLDPASGTVTDVHDDLTPNSLNTDGRYVYCANRRNDSTVYRLDPQTGRSIRICGESADYLHVIGEDLFFRGVDGWLTMSLHGGQATKVMI